MATKPTTHPAPTAPPSVEPLHRLHSYCARFPSEIAEAAIDQFTHPGESVCDHFCGSGTSLVAGLVRKRRVVGSDIDVLAGILSSVKCSPLPLERYTSWRGRFAARLKELFEEINAEWLPELSPRPGDVLSIGSVRLEVPTFPQLNYWFPPQVIAFLSAIAHAANRCRDEHYEHAALVSLSAAIIAKWPNTLSYAMDYPRAHRLSVCWMNGHAPAELASRRDYIGLRHLGDFKATEWLQERKDIQRLIPSGLRDTVHERRLAAFFSDMESVLEQTWRVLQPTGHALFVIADNSVDGHRIKAHRALVELAKSKGFAEILRKPRPIASLRRRFPVGTFGFDGPMTHEHVVVLRKPKPQARTRKASGSR